MLSRHQLQLHPFHLVSISPWPLFLSFSLLNLTVGGVLCFHGAGNWPVAAGLVCTLLSITYWLRDVSAEGSYLGEHTVAVQRGLTLGFTLFVVTEFMFFVSLFWAYLHSGLSPSIELGTQWPPVGIAAIDPFSLPLLNTLLLLGSGAAVTYAHHALIGGDRSGALLGLVVTIFLAVLFTSCQVLEYYNSDFSLSDSVYGSTFFLATRNARFPRNNGYSFPCSR